MNHWSRTCEFCDERIYSPRHSIEIHEGQKHNVIFDIHKRCFKAYLLSRMKMELVDE